MTNDNTGQVRAPNRLSRTWRIDVSLIGVAIVWGASYLAAKDVAEEISVASLLSWRFIITLAGMLAAGVFRPTAAAAVGGGAPPPPPPAPPVGAGADSDALTEWFAPPWSLGVRYRPEWSEAELAAALAGTAARVFHPVKREVSLPAPPPPPPPPRAAEGEPAAKRARADA
jgi:drug/metabolite transporter (DMT)-like permease